VDLKSVALENLAFQSGGKKRAGGNGELDGGSKGASIAPHPPEGGHGRKSQTFKLAGGQAQGLGQAGRQQKQRDAAQQERQDEIGKAVGVGQGNEAEVGPIGPQAHRGDNIIDISQQLRRGESDETGGAGGAGSDFEMGATGGQGRERGTFAGGVERANHSSALPGAEDFENERRAGAAREKNGIIGGQGRGGLVHLAESPALTGAKIGQGQFVGTRADYFLPGGVQHCQITMGRLCWAQVLMTVIAADRVFDFETDTFAYPNELVWEYHLDAQTGQGRPEKRNPPPTYAHHCFVVARAARQFLRRAAFDPQAAAVSDAEFLGRIRSVARSDPRESSFVVNKIQIPGFAHLRQFSQARPDLLKAGCGGAWQSYAQRGNWRMVLPFSRAGQERMAAKLSERLATGRLPIVHVATFPSLTMNHAVLFFGCLDTGETLEFQAYDPNICERPLSIFYDRKSRWFHFPRTHYFAGGRVNAYEIYCGAWR
jgi:hypothetical protein